MDNSGGSMAGEIGWMSKLNGLKITKFVKERERSTNTTETILKTPTKGGARGLELGYIQCILSISAQMAH